MAEKAFRREIDLGDGSGKQVFEADTAEELNDVLATAQTNATKKIRDQNEELKTLRRQSVMQPESGERDPSGPMPEFKTRALTQDEKFALGQRLLNPATAVDALMEAIELGLGSNLGQVRQALGRAESTPRQLVAERQGEAFLLNHPEFISNKKNSDEMVKYMEAKGMAYTLANYEKAYAVLAPTGLLEIRARQPETNGNGTSTNGAAADSAAAGAGAAVPRFASTSVATRGSGTPRAAGGSKMPSAEEIERMTASQHKKWLSVPGFIEHEERLAQQQSRRRQA